MEKGWVRWKSGLGDRCWVSGGDRGKVSGGDRAKVSGGDRRGEDRERGHRRGRELIN